MIGLEFDAELADEFLVAVRPARNSPGKLVVKLEAMD